MSGFRAVNSVKVTDADLSPRALAIYRAMPDDWTGYWHRHDDPDGWWVEIEARRLALQIAAADPLQAALHRPDAERYGITFVDSPEGRPMTLLEWLEHTATYADLAPLADLLAAIRGGGK